jgi:hypothetical protein
LSIATGIGTILGVIFIPETSFSALVHSVCMIFLGESFPLATQVISTLMMTAAAILLPMLISEGIMRIAMTATEVAASEHAREHAQEDKPPTAPINLDSAKSTNNSVFARFPISSSSKTSPQNKHFSQSL